MKTLFDYLTGGLIGMMLMLAIIASADAQDVKYCKNFQTGEIYVVEANMPCPYPTAEI